MAPSPDVGDVAHPAPPRSESVDAQRDSIGAYQWYALVLLVMVYTVHAMDRMVINVLVEPIRQTFQLSDSALGFLTGLGYAIPFALFGLPLGALADRRKRTVLLSALISVWSVFTALGGLAQHYYTLLFTRMAVGATESGSPPTALSLVTDYFQPRVRPMAVSVFFFGGPLGVALGALLAGEVASAHDWRFALFAAMVPGLIVGALVLLTLREPVRGGLDQTQETVTDVPLAEVLRLVAREPRLSLLIAALVLASMASVGVVAWAPALVMRAFHVPIAEAGRYIAVAGLMGGLGTLLGGVLSSVYAKGRAERLLLMSGVALLLAVPLFLVGLSMQSFAIFLPLYLCWSLAHVIYLGPCNSLLLGLTPAPMRGRVMALSLILCNIIGAGVGPQIAGLLSDVFAAMGDARALTHAMMALTLAAALAGMLLLWALRHVPPGMPQPLKLHALQTGNEP
ncbi:MAG: MFS transporter [Spongiibacteraceae bacterium]